MGGISVDIMIGIEKKWGKVVFLINVIWYFKIGFNLIEVVVINFN